MSDAPTDRRRYLETTDDLEALERELLGEAADDQPHRRREDRLVAVIRYVIRLEREGSCNFRNWRRRATVGFAILVAATTLEGAVIVKNARHSRSDLARAGAVVAISGCQHDNELTAAIRGFVASTAPDLGDVVATTFPGRDCFREAQPLRSKIAP